MGGVEGATCTLANNLVNNGHEVNYIALIDFVPFFKLDSRVKYLTPTFSNLPKYKIFKTFRWIRKVIGNDKPDFVIVYSKFIAALVNISLVFTSHKIVLSERSSPYYKWPWHIEIFCRLSFWIKKPRGIISQTQIAKEVQGKYYGKTVPIEVIPNAVRDINLFPNIKREDYILAVGRFNDECKGFDLLLKAIRRLENKTWKVKFLGGTKDEGNLFLLAKKLGIVDRVEFLGKIENIDSILAGAGIFVIPSRSEGFPNALAEAMSAGVPCVSFDFIGGARDLITHNVDGIIVPHQDIKALANVIDSLIKDPLKREILGKNALSIRERLHKTRISSLTNEFLNKLE